MDTGKGILSIENLLKLYTSISNDEYELIKALMNYLKFFASLLMAIIGGTLFLQSKSDNTFITGTTFIIGGLLVCFISYLGLEAAKSNYRRQLESIVKRFKLECLMQLDNVNLTKTGDFFKGESFILPRYIESMKGYSDSRQFVKDKLKQGFMKVIKKFYFVMSIVGVFIILIGVYYLINPK